MLRTSAPGWFKQRCPFCDIFSTKGKYRDGTKQLYGLGPTCVFARRRLPFHRLMFLATIIVGLTLRVGNHHAERDDYDEKNRRKLNVGEHASCVEIDAGVECARVVVEAYETSLRRINRLTSMSSVTTVRLSSGSSRFDLSAVVGSAGKRSTESVS